MERYRSGHNGADSKSVCAQAHEGSNPSLSAITTRRSSCSSLLLYREVRVRRNLTPNPCADLRKGRSDLLPFERLFNILINKFFISSSAWIWLPQSLLWLETTPRHREHRAEAPISNVACSYDKRDIRRRIRRKSRTSQSVASD